MKIGELMQMIIAYLKKVNMIFLFLFLAYIVTAGFVGGLGLAVLLGSVLVTASLLSIKSEFLITRESIVLSYLVHVVWLALFFTFGLSFVRSNLSFLFHKNIDSSLFHPLEYAHQGTEFSRIGSLLIILAPSVYMIVKLLLARDRKASVKEKRKWGSGTFAAWVTLMPYLYIAIIKFQNPWKALNFVMSGDGRNHLHFVEQIRTTSHATLSLRHVGVPVLGNATGALISAANGAHGYLDMRDIWGIQSVYIFGAGILTAVAAIFLTTFFSKDKFIDHLILVIPILLLSIFVSNSGYIVFPILYDGFFSLYFGIAVLSLVICYFHLRVENKRWATSLIFVLSTWCVATSYTYLAPASLVITLVYIYFLWRELPKSNLKKYSTISALVLVPIAIFLLKRQFIVEFKYRGQMAGSVWPTNAVVLLIFFLVSLFFISVLAGSIRRFFICISLIIVATAAMLLYIESLPANRGVSYSYYSSKLIIGTVGMLFMLVPLLVSFFFRTTTWNLLSTSKTKQFVAVACMSAIPIVVIHPLNTHHPFMEIRRGWVNPDAKSVETVINQWKTGPKLYFQFAKNEGLFEYPSFSADRMLNFWSPISWDANGEYSKFYTWTYLGQVSSDPAILCDIIRTKPITVVTRNPELPTLVANSCGPTETKFKIEK